METMVKIYKLSDFDSKEEMLEKINELEKLVFERNLKIRELTHEVNKCYFDSEKLINQYRNQARKINLRRNEE